MKNLQKLISGLFVLIAAAGLAAAQTKSLAELPAGEKFTSTDANFTISLPREPSKSTKVEPTKEANERGGSYTWSFTEGVINITYNEVLDGTAFRTDKDYEMFFSGFKTTILADKDVKLISEEPYKSGDFFRGMRYQLDYTGLKSQTIIAAFGARYYSMTTVYDPDVADAEKIIRKAADTFTIISPPPPKN